MIISAFYENIGQAAKETGTPISEFLRQLKNEGLESVYISYFWVMKKQEEQVMTDLNRLGISVEGLWGPIQFHSMTDDEAKAAYQELVDCAVRVGAKNVLIIPGIFNSAESKISRREVAEGEHELQLMIRRMREAVKYGKGKGIKVTLEDFDNFTSPVVFPDVLRRFFEEIPDLTCSFDTGNFVPCDVDVMEEFTYYQNRIATFHLKDRVENNDQGGVEKTPYITQSGRKYYPAVVGMGDMHIPEIIKEMKEIGYQGAGIIELFSSTDMARKLFASVRWMKENAK